MYTIDGGKLRKHIIIHPESDSESESDEEGKGLYAGGGGSIKSVLNKAGKYITAKKGGLASTLVNRGIPAITGGLGGAAAMMIAPEGGPVSGLVGSQLGALGGRYASQAIDNSAGTGMKKRGRPRGGKLKSDLVQTYNKVVPKSMQPAVNNLAGQVGNYALDKAGYSGNPIPVKGGKLKNDLVQAYNKVVPKSMQPAVNELAGQVGNYALKSAGYGEPIPVGKGIRKGRMVKGSPEAKAWAEKMRQSRKK